MASIGAAETAPPSSDPDDGGGRSAWALGLAGLAALLASGCCVLPLVFVLVGISGAWIGQLTRLEPYSLWLDALALGALGLAAWRIYRPASGSGSRAVDPDSTAAPGTTAASGVDCGPACARTRPALRAAFWLVALLVLLPIAVPLLAPLFYE